MRTVDASEGTTRQVVNLLKLFESPAEMLQLNYPSYYALRTLHLRHTKFPVLNPRFPLVKGVKNI